MDPRWKPVIVGLVTGLGLLVLPEGLGPLIVILGAVVSGWVLASAPMPAAVLFLAPAIVLGSVRLLTSDERPAVGGLLLALILAVAFVAIFTHLGAGVALRANAADRVQRILVLGPGGSGKSTFAQELSRR